MKCPRCNGELEVSLKAVGTTPEPGLVKVWVGAYDLLGAIGDTSRFLRKCKAAGAAGCRIFICYSWNAEQTGFQPYLKVGFWTHDNGTTFPKYRLGDPYHPSWDESFWHHLRLTLMEMKILGLSAWLVAEDFCSLKGDSRVKYYNPFYSSEEDLGPNTPGGIWGYSMKRYHEALFQKIIETANSTGVDYLMEAMNEADVVDGTVADVIAWNIWAHDSMVSLGFQRGRIAASPGRGQIEIESSCRFISPHGIGRADQIQPLRGIDIGKTIFSSDGWWAGTGGADAKGRRGVGVTEALEIRQRLIETGSAGFELLPREIYGQDNDRANLDLFDPSPIDIMALGVIK